MSLHSRDCLCAIGLRRWLGAAAVLAAAAALSACGSDSPTTPAGPGPAPSTRQIDPRIAAADNQFGFQVFSSLQKADPSSNIFISPSSIAIALAMAYNGAGGATAAGMAQTLGVQGWTLDVLNQANADFINVLQNPDSKVSLTVADSLWARQGFNLSPGFVQRNQQFYNAEVTDLDFTSPAAPTTINNWVSQATQGLIPKVIDQISPDEILFLINAIYFKGTWTSQFDPKLTQNAPFTLAGGTQEQVPMMNQFNTYPYLETSKFQAISLPYGTGRLAMFVFLPAANSSLSEFMGSLTATNWNTWMGQFHSKEGSIALPRFQCKYNVGLNDTLKALGMSAAFDPNQADFSGISPGGRLFLTNVQHQTYLDVDELGTTAAAITTIGVGTAVGPVDTFNMTVNRPFFLAIRDSQSGAVIFMGAIVKP